jgi:hypothetical protein
MAFSRATLFEACTFLGQILEEDWVFDNMLLRWELDDLRMDLLGSIPERFQRLFLFLRDEPAVQFDGRLIWELVVEEAVSRALITRRREEISVRVGAERFVHALERDGYIIDENRQLHRTLPEIVDLPAAQNEVDLLLTQYNLTVPVSHLAQAMDSHTRGNWAAANGQLRTFYESLFDEMAILVDPQNAPPTQTGQARRQYLANLNPPFLSRDLNEWSNDGKNFVNGVFKRLCPQGAHPGLSDEEDCTFRLHLVVLTARLFLRRLDTTIRDGR